MEQTETAAKLVRSKLGIFAASLGVLSIGICLHTGSIYIPLAILALLFGSFSNRKINKDRSNINIKILSFVSIAFSVLCLTLVIVFPF